MQSNDVQEPVRIFIGYDSKQDVAYDVLRWSILRRAHRPVHIEPLILTELTQGDVRFNRSHDPLQSTEFTYTRFLVPYLMNYEGIALFMDSDMLALGDVTELFDLPMRGLSLRVVKHDHRPTETTKMGGLKQTLYPRKNWSSLMLMNCAELRCWTKTAVETMSGAWLHRFEPIPDWKIGDIDGKEWNVLDYYNDDTKLIHYTAGGPWLADCKNHPYGDIWKIEANHVRIYDGVKSRS